jgi:hypothetical protein
MILREAAQQALEVLHEIDSPMLVKEIAKVGKAITALRAALAKSEQDPLTDEEIEQCCYDADKNADNHTDEWTKRFARAIERAHGIGGEE